MTAQTPAFLSGTLLLPGQAPGAITALRMEDVADTIASISLGALTPQMFGALGDGSTNDTVALNACFAAACSATVPVFLPPGIYMTTGLLITSNVSSTQQASPPNIIGAGFTRSIIRAFTGATSPLVKLQNVYGCVCRDFQIDGANLVATCFDTSWNVGFGPSLQIVYDHLSIRNYTSQGWVALANNDCYWRNCLMDSPSHTGVYSLFIDAHGGALHFDACGFANTTVGIACQSAVFVNCITYGVRIIGVDTNQILYAGGYHYADKTTGINFDIPSTRQATLCCTDARFENVGAGSGLFVGGSTSGGTLFLGATFLCSRFLNTSSGGSTALSLIGSGLVTGLGGGNFGVVRLLDCILNSNISLTAPTNFYVNSLGSIIDSTALPALPEAFRVGRASYTDQLVNGMRSVDAGWGNTGCILSYTVLVSSGTPGVITGIPNIGSCIVAASGGVVPNTQFRYADAVKDTAFSNNDGSAHTISGAVSFTTAWSLTLTTNNATATEYTVTIFGQQ